MSSVPKIAVQNLDHLGLVAGLIDEIGIVEKINIAVFRDGFKECGMTGMHQCLSERPVHF